MLTAVAASSNVWLERKTWSCQIIMMTGIYMLATPLLTSNVIYIKCFITAIFTGSVYIVTGTVFSTSCLGIPSLPNTPTQSLFFFAYAAKLY
jgi:hypothetical protein